MRNNLYATLISFFLMIFVWSWMFGSWTFALGLLVLVGIHEMGHYVVGALGITVTLPIFTPFGGMVSMKETPRNAYDEALVAFAGPFVGTIGALGAMVLAIYTDSSAIMQIANAGLFLNLLNLVPLAPLDGGRISMAIERRLWVLGVLLLAVMFYFIGFSGINGLVLLLIVYSAYQDVKQRTIQAVETPEYFAVGLWPRVTASVAYLAMIGFLVFTLTGL